MKSILNLIKLFFASPRKNFRSKSYSLYEKCRLKLQQDLDFCQSQKDCFYCNSYKGQVIAYDDNGCSVYYSYCNLFKRSELQFNETSRFKH